MESIKIDSIIFNKNNILNKDINIINRLYERNSISYDFNIYEVTYINEDVILAYYIEYIIPCDNNIKYIDIITAHNIMEEDLENTILRKIQNDNNILYIKCNKKYLNSASYIIKNGFRLVNDYIYKDYYTFKWEGFY